MTWKLRYAPHLGIRTTEKPLFRHSVGSTDPIEQLHFIAEQGFAGVEDNFAVTRPPEVLDRMGHELVRLGLEMGSIGNVGKSLFEPMWGLPGKEVRERLAAELDLTIAAAKRLGGRYINVFGARDPALPLGYQFANFTEHLRHLAQAADKVGMVIVLEQVSAQQLPGMLIQDIADLYAIVTAVNAPSVRILFDSVHCQSAGGNLTRSLEMCWDKLALVQIADVPGRGEPGTGEINFPYVLRQLRDRGYAGLVELEFHPSLPGKDGEQAALARLRAIDAGI